MENTRVKHIINTNALEYSKNKYVIQRGGLTYLYPITTFDNLFFGVKLPNTSVL